MTTQIKETLFTQSRKMRLYSETGQAVPVSMMAERCACTEAEVIETWKWFIDNGFDQKENFTLEITSNYDGLLKKPSFATAVMQAKFDAENNKKNIVNHI